MDYSRTKKHDHYLTVAEFCQALILKHCLESPQSTKTFSSVSKSSKNHTVDGKAYFKYLQSAHSLGIIETAQWIIEVLCNCAQKNPGSADHEHDKFQQCLQTVYSLWSI